MRLESKVSIVTGGASGMGAAESVLFASEGSHVVVADMRIEDGMEIVDEIKSSGGNATFMELDVTDEKRWSVVVADVLSQFGTIDVLVNNAGLSGSYQSDIMSLEAYDRLMNVNSRGVFLGMRS
ncbi:MAG: SDR family NAD(P)-dependent oxidoreductase, partial [Chloroflexota bacterium]|nr:SDR family NAD(P)-dependent oxidoreductase [Chloroflexota bacterium]